MNLTRTANQRRTALPVVFAGALTFLPISSALAQQPVHAATRVTLHHTSAVTQAQPEAAYAAEAEAPQTPPTPPTPPNPNSFRDDLFAGTEKFAKNASDATEVNMDPDSLRYVGGSEAARAHRTVLSVVRTYSYDKPGMYSMAEVEEYRRKLETGDWHCSIHTRDLKTGESTDICNKHLNGDLIENAIITVSPKSLTFIHNIRHANGQGGHMDIVVPGVSMLNDLPPSAYMAVLSPAMQADLAASTAEMAAESASMRAEMLESTAAVRREIAQNRVHMPNGSQVDMDHLRDELDHVRDKVKDLPSIKDNQELDRLREQLRDLKDLGQQ